MPFAEFLSIFCSKTAFIWVACLTFAHLTNISSFHPAINTKSNQLPDLIHSLTTLNNGDQWIDHSSPSSPFYGICDLLLVPPFLLLLSCLYRANATSRQLIISELMKLHGILVVLRGVLINSTTLPSPISQCHDATEPPQSLFIKLYCNDQIFSGHTTVNLLCMMAVSFDISCNRMVKWFGWISVIIASMISIISRDHYTVDVLLAFIITIGGCWIRRIEFINHWTKTYPKQE